MFIIPTIAMSAFILSDVLIEDALPDTTIAVVSVQNAEDLSNKLEAMGVCDAVCEFAQLITSDNDEIDLTSYSSMCQNLFDVMGLEKDALPDCPSGMIQAGVYPVVDYEAGSVSVGLLAIAELGKSQWSSIIENSMTDLASELNLQIEEVDLSGESVWMLSTTVNTSVGDVDLSGIDLERMYIALHSGYLVVGTDPDGVASAIGVINGKEEKDSLANSELWSELTSRVKDNGDASGAVLLTNLADTIMQMDDSGMSMMILPMIKSFVGDVDGIMETVAFDSTGNTALDATYTIYMSEGRNGLLGLISEETADVEIPSYVTEDTLSYSQIQIDMDKVVPFLMQTISSNPMLAMQIGPQSDQIEQMLQQAFAPLGSRVHMLSTGYLPVDNESLGYLVAIECVDEPAFNDFLATVMPGMGADPTDFLGYQIYTTDLGGGMMLPMDLSFSFTVAGGYVFIGSTRPVQQALRSIANPSNSTYANNDNEALQYISRTGATGWGYADPAKSMEIQSQVMGEVSDDMFADMEAFDPEMAAEMRKEFEDSQRQQAVLMKMFSGLLGQTSWILKTDSNGFTAHAVMLSATDN